MKEEVSLYLFDKHIASLYQIEDKVYVKQIANRLHLASPISIEKNIEEFETTNLKFLDQTPGIVSDSLPGSFAAEILNNFFLQNHSKYPSIVDKLLFIGDKGLGALVFKPSFKYQQSTKECLELKEMFEKAKELKKGGEFHSLHNAFLVSAHSFVGGARAKAVCSIDLKTKNVYLGDRNKTPKGYTPVILKYDDTANGDENKSTYSKLEYIYYLLAKEIGLHMMPCYLLEANGKFHFATKRFDVENNKRFHIHSLAGLLHIDYNIPRVLGYEDLFRVAIKLNATSSLEQLFVQMLFNYMFVNQDDHARNFSFMCDEKYEWKTTPAYDITFAKGIKQTLEHQLSLYGKALSMISLEDVTKLAVQFGVDLEFVSSALEQILKIRKILLPQLLKKYNIATKKQEQVLKETNKRNLQGGLS